MLSPESGDRAGACHDRQCNGDNSRVTRAAREPCRRFRRQASAFCFTFKAFALGRFFSLYAPAIGLSLPFRGRLLSQ